MPNVIAVRFRGAGKPTYYDPGIFTPQPGEKVIVPTLQGLDIAQVTQGVHEIPAEPGNQPIRQVVRPATPGDLQQQETNRLRERQAFAQCRERIAAHKLDMKLVGVEYAFDGSKLTAFFTSGGRVDFRALVRDLAGIFRTRIELKQIGVRDEAKMMGGLGSCGRNLCCAQYLSGFQPVSIRMAKEQSLSLNPTKISGVCGRLLCCLKYEKEQYERSRKKMPRLGREVITPQGRGIVTGLNPLLETVQVRIANAETSEIRTYPADQVQRIGIPGQKPEIPSPEETAPTFLELDEEFLGTIGEAKSGAANLLDED